MSNPYLPPELLDYIVDFLHDDQTTLKKCCLVSKPWIPRARKHLFAEIRLEKPELWKKMFPDPSTSPANFAKSLHFDSAHAITAADAEPGGWLTGFVHIVHLGVETREKEAFEEPLVSLAPFHRFSPTIKSLRLGSTAIPPSWISKFILSSPLLEDLTVTTYGVSVDDGNGSDDPSTVLHPPNPPAFTGSLDLPLGRRIKPIASRLLSMPGGIHFRKLTLECCCEEDLLVITALVRECSRTLESLNINFSPFADWLSTSVDLSKTTRLKDLTFRINSSGAKWATMPLRTITPKHRDLRRITIYPTYYSGLVMFGSGARRHIGEQALAQWLELDHILGQLRESHSITPEILYYYASSRDEKTIRDLVGRLLPEITCGGMVNLVNAG